MTIYLDIIWLLNFGIDAFLLILTGVILKKRLITWRVLLGAFIGSSIVLLYFSPLANVISHPVTRLFYSLCMVFITFGFKRFRNFLQTLCTFYFVTFMIGGGLIGLHYFFQAQTEWVNGVVTTKTTGMGDPVSWGFLLIGFPLLWYFSKKQIDEIEVKKIHYDQVVNVEIKIEHIHIVMKGLIDSGNQLYDPITKTPVMILDINHFKSEFPSGLINQVKTMDNLQLDEEEHVLTNRIRIIPYRGVGQSHQFLLALKPDEVRVKMNNEWFQTSKVLIGLNDTPLSSNGEYECIVHPKMFSNAKTLTA